MDMTLQAWGMMASSAREAPDASHVSVAGSLGPVFGGAWGEWVRGLGYLDLPTLGVQDWQADQSPDQ